MVQRADSAGETDCGGVVCWVWNILCDAGVGAEGMVVCVGEFGAGGHIDLVCGVSGESWIHRGDAEKQGHREELNADFADQIIF